MNVVNIPEDVPATFTHRKVVSHGQHLRVALLWDDGHGCVEIIESAPIAGDPIRNIGQAIGFAVNRLEPNRAMEMLACAVTALFSVSDCQMSDDKEAMYDAACVVNGDVEEEVKPS